MAEIAEERFYLELLKVLNKKREEVNVLTREIMALENNPSPQNITQIRQNITNIINALACCQNSKNNILKRTKGKADLILHQMRTGEQDSQAMDTDMWRDCIVRDLDEFCILANGWNPIEFDFNNKKLRIVFKNINVGLINLPK